MNLENVKYDAFISYRHCQADKFVAENLHKQLEAFKVPKSLIKTGKTNGKTKIERVFRDRDELPLASNLADPITQALQSSDYLIVICSPRLSESKWCLKEIETFIEMHGRDHVLAVLIEGEPADSFPDILRYDERKVTDADGNTHIVKVEVEPLAADVRGKDNAEVLKQIKSELMRLVAPMLGCNYDDLRMRHKEARQKRILRISLAISIVCIIFTAISTTMALTINKQSKTIEEQYRASLKTQAISYASISQTLLKEEDRMAAMAVARIALPDSLENQQEKPYTAAAEYALADSLAIYNDGESNCPVRTLEQRSPIRFMRVSPDERTLTTVDVNGIITIYDIQSAQTIVSYKVDPKYAIDISATTDLCYLDANTLVYVANDGYCLYDISTKTETFYQLDDNAYYIISADETHIGISTSKCFYVMERSGKELFCYEYPESCHANPAMAIDTDKKLCAFTTENSEGDVDNGSLIVANYESGEIIYIAQTGIVDCEDCMFYDDQIIIAASTSDIGDENVLEVHTQLQVEAYPLDNSTANWKLYRDDSSFSEMTTALEWESPIIAISGYDEMMYINTQDGSLIKSIILSSKIVDITPLVSNGSVIATTERGEKVIVSSDSYVQNLIVEEFDTSNGAFSDFYYSNDFIAAHHTNATCVHIYETICSDQAKTVLTASDRISKSSYSEKQKAFITEDFGDQYMVHHISDNSSITLDYDEYSTDMFFVGENDEQIVIVNTSSLTYFDTITGKPLESISITDNFNGTGYIPGNYIGHSQDNSTIAFFSGATDTLHLYTLESNEINTITLTKPLNNNNQCIAINEAADKFVIACTTDNTLSLFDKNNNLLAETEIDASLVCNIIISDTANCIIISHLDQTATFYNLTDLSVIKTVTSLNGNVSHLDLLDFKSTNDAPNVPVYALYGTHMCYLLNENLELVAQLYSYTACDSTSQTFYLAKDCDMLAVPYYNYDMLIQEADKQLQNYQLSNYRKNQLGL